MLEATMSVTPGEPDWRPPTKIWGRLRAWPRQLLMKPGEVTALDIRFGIDRSFVRLSIANENRYMVFDMHPVAARSLASHITEAADQATALEMAAHDDRKQP
jgi:hypothetical protein